jgi:anti-sigma B factor antagonist
MDIEVSQVDGVEVATLFGELDGRTAPEVQEKLLALAQPGARLLLDMQGVNYISSAGLRALLMLYRQIGQEAGRVALAGLIEPIRDTMAVTGFLEFFTAYDSVAEGVAALRQDQL